MQTIKDLGSVELDFQVLTSLSPQVLGLTTNDYIRHGKSSTRFTALVAAAVEIAIQAKDARQHD